MTSPGCLSTVCFVSEMKQGFENERQSWSGETIVISEFCLLENEALRAGNFGSDILEPMFHTDVQVLF